MLCTALCWGHSCRKMCHINMLLSDRSFRCLVLNREIASIRRHMGSFLGETLVVLMMTGFNRKPISWVGWAPGQVLNTAMCGIRMQDEDVSLSPKDFCGIQKAVCNYLWLELFFQLFNIFVCVIKIYNKLSRNATVM